MINSNEYTNLISQLAIKFTMFAFVFLAAAMYSITLSFSMGKLLLTVGIIIILFASLFVIFKKELFKYDAEIGSHIHLNGVYKTIVANAPLALIVTDGNKISYFNAASQKLFRKSKHFLETCTIYDLVHSNDKNKLQEMIRTSNGIDNVVLLINNENLLKKQYANFSIQKQLFSGKDRFVIFAYDVTEYHTALVDVEEKISIYQETINASPALVYIIDTNGKMYFKNKKAKQNQVFDSEDSFASIIEYDADRSLLNTAFQIAVGGNQYTEEKITARRKNYYEWARIAFTPIIANNGNKYVYYRVDDITDYKQKIDKYELLLHANIIEFERTQLAKVIWDADGNFVKANKPFYDLFNFRPGVLGTQKLNFFNDDIFIAKAIKEIVFNFDEPTKRISYSKNSALYGVKKFFEQFQKVEAFEVVMNVDVSIFAPNNNNLNSNNLNSNNKKDANQDDDFYSNDRKEIWVKTCSYPVFDKAGQLTSFVSEFLDITEVFELQSKFNTTKNHLDAIANNFSSGIILIINSENQIVFIGGENDIKRQINTKGYNIARRAFDFAAIPEFAQFKDNVYAALRNNFSKISSLLMFNNTYDIQFFPIRNISTKVEYCMVIGFNVTDRENSEKQIILQKNFLEKAFSESTIPAIIINTQGKYRNANQKYIEFMGFDTEQVVDTDIYSKDCWLHKEIIISNFEQILQGSDTTEFEITEEKSFSFVEEDGSEVKEVFKFSLIGKCYPIMDANKNIESVVFNFIDVSNTRRLIENMEAAHAINNAVTTNFPNSILMLLDKDMKIILFEGQNEINNVKMSEMRILDKFLSEIDAPIIDQVKPYVANAINTNQEVNFDFSIDIKDSDEEPGFDIYYEVYIVPILDYHKALEYVFILFNNITGRKQLEKAILNFNEKLESQVTLRTMQLKETAHDLEVYVNELQDTQDKLKEKEKELADKLKEEQGLNQMKTQFISLISHEFRTPLTVVQTCIYLMESCYEMRLKDKFDSSLQKAIMAIDMITQLIDKVLLLDEIKDYIPKFSISDTVLFIKTIIANTKSNLNAQQNIHINANENTLLMYTDEKLLKEIITNLLSNAIIYSPPTSDIFIDINSEDTQLIFTVTDLGMGISDDVIDKIFEKFTRSADVTNKSGSGLGLAIVKICADLLRGDITFKTEKDKGSTFTVTLPKLSQDDINVSSDILG